MNKRLNKIEKLIDELCPEGVEFKKLTNLANSITTGKLNANAQVKNGAYPFFTCDANAFKIDTFAFDGEAIIVSGNGSQVGHINYYFGKFNAYQRTYVISDFNHVNVKYLLHYLKGYLREYIFENSRKGSVPYITMPMLENFIIPIPPLAIQQEIVNILDTFTTLEAELEAELEARKKQYEYYRDELLTFGEDVEWKTLGDICNIRTGQAPNIEVSSNEGNYPFINAGLEPSGYLIETNTPAETITIPSRGQGGAGHVGYQKSEFWCGPLCYKIQSSKREFITKFIYYYLRTIQEKIVGLRQTGSIPAVNRKELILIKIPAIAIYEQERIVAILDKFDALVNDISVGLPAELNARRKHYEYYRNKLLTFKPLEKDHANQYPI